VAKPTDEDFSADVRLKAAANLHHARHYLLHPHDLEKVVHKLVYVFKECFYAMQSWMLLTTSTYYAQKTELMSVLDDPDDREVIRIARDWHISSKDRVQRPEYYIKLLERWRFAAAFSRTSAEKSSSVGFATRFSNLP